MNTGSRVHCWRVHLRRTGEALTVRLLWGPGGLRARRRRARWRACPTASAWKCVAAMDTTSPLMRSTRYSAATLHAHLTADVDAYKEMDESNDEECPTASSGKCMAAMDTTLPLMRSTRYSATILRIQLRTLDGFGQCTAQFSLSLQVQTSNSVSSCRALHRSPGSASEYILGVVWL